ncbi:MAG: endonuclease/exonuclease/phosphatase family protein [Rhodobacterales bacterium]|nr:endonuclease/exonuclease/phosphatase family protein [Rhodobacterales bacterium]
MTTPLDVLFLDPANRPPDTLSQAALDELRALPGLLDGIIPPKRDVSANLLIATWNIAHFRSLTKRWQVPAQSSLSPKRDYRCLWAITEILSRFDVIAVQEVGGDLRALRYALKVLGPGWGFLMTDVSRGTGGNNERMAYLYDKDRVSLSGLAGELVVPDESHEYGFKEGAFKKQFARNPYAVSFKSRNATFILVTAHIDYGDVDEERIPELKAIAQWMRDWAKDSYRWHHNLLVLGDFNLDRDDNKMYRAFTETHLTVPQALHAAPRTIYASPTDPRKGSYHDQIAWFIDGDANLINMELVTGGTIPLRQFLLNDLGLTNASFAPRISDHYPLWVEFRTPG